MRPESNAYREAGVDIEAGKRATDLMAEAVESTYTPHVLAGLGAFGGLFDAAHLKALNAPLLVASTDGVGTKTLVAARLNRWETIGQDLVNHCVNDILVQGAEPLFFLDYVASARLAPEQVATIVQGMARACRDAGCALLGGETAEMPGVYHEGALDVVGTIVGVLDREHLIDGTRIQAGDMVLAFPSSGLHTNGYTLARRVLDDEDWNTPHPLLDGQSIGEALLAIHRSYLPHVRALRTAGIDLRGLAHITGGGVFDNVPRILPEGLGVRLRLGTWPMPAIFTLIQHKGHVDREEMFHVFNMGLGMLAFVPEEDAQRAVEVLGEQECFIVGRVVAEDGIQLVN
nr:phosphoribosylformylglycinamidine cyclo-ligase [Ardenticatena sp.]